MSTNVEVAKKLLKDMSSSLDNQNSNVTVLKQTLKSIGVLPAEGTPDDSDINASHELGNYVLKDLFNWSPAGNLLHFLAEEKNTGKLHILKVLVAKSGIEKKVVFDCEGKSALNTEYLLLKKMDGEIGVVKVHATFKEYSLDTKIDSLGNKVYTGEIIERRCLVLDTLLPFATEQPKIVSLQKFMYSNPKLSELEILKIFYSLTKAVKAIHDRNIAHMNIKLNTLVIDEVSREVFLNDFYYARELLDENTFVMNTQRPNCYLPQEVFNWRSFAGKPVDMWSLGVILYALLFSKYPFYHDVHSLFVEQVKAAEFKIPENKEVNMKVLFLLKGLLKPNPYERFTASKVVISMKIIIADLSPVNIEEAVPVVEVPNNSAPGVPIKLKRSLWLNEQTNYEIKMALNLTSTLLRTFPYLRPNFQSRPMERNDTQPQPSQPKKVKTDKSVEETNEEKPKKN